MHKPFIDGNLNKDFSLFILACMILFGMITLALLIAMVS